MRRILIFLGIFVLTLGQAYAIGLTDDKTNNEIAETLTKIKENKSTAELHVWLNNLLHIYKTRFTAESPEYADCMQWCAYICSEAGDNEQAKNLLRRSSEIFKKYGDGRFAGRDTVNEILRLDLQSKIDYNSKSEYKAIRHASRACELKRKYYGEKSEVYLTALLDLSRLHAERLNYNKSNRYHNLGYDAYIERIKQEFCQSSESERISYWDKAIRYIDKTLELAHKSSRKSHHGGDRSLASAAYNAVLLSKGLLLNTNVNFENYILSSGNVDAILQWQEKKRLADSQASQEVLDSLDFEILHSLERAGQKFDLPHLSITWKDVAAKLGKNDVAIEFYRTRKGDYGAIVLKHGWASPRIVKLKEIVKSGKGWLQLENSFSNVSLETLTPEQTGDLWHLSTSVWTDDIVRYFPPKGEGNIYFSADGELLLTGIEYLPFTRSSGDGSLHCLADLFNVYRLSSTRQLVMPRKEPGRLEASVYGGLDYNMLDEEMLADAQLYQPAPAPAPAPAPMPEADLAFEPGRKTRDLRESGSGIKELEGTKVEAESIVEIINTQSGSQLKARPFIGKQGTESSFKSLSGKRESLIHVATHGYFYNENDPAFSKFNLGDNVMVRSGLLMAGADNKWNGYDLPEGVDDGFLTSLEISNMDLRGLDLVVLSACQTGAGKIQSDGVFGLQRGFKMASADSILMSLWKVDDDATALLMIEFYKNWIGNGKSKREALQLAQNAVRSHKERGWDSPKYWAAFILLDAMD